MYCKQCNRVLQANFFDEYAKYCSEFCEARAKQNARIGNVMTWIIGALLVGTLILWAFPANADQDVTSVEVTEEVTEVIVEPVFDMNVADNMVVKITELDGTFRSTGFYIGNDIVVIADHATEEEVKVRTVYGYLQMPPTQFEHLLVWNKNGKVVLGTVSYKDTEQDVATLVLSNNNLSLTAVTFAESEPERGDDLFSIGHPNGITWSFMRGYLAHKTSTLESGEIRGLADMMSLGGSSGSPIFNKRGEVVGVLTENFSVGSGILFVPISVFKDKIYATISE